MKKQLLVALALVGAFAARSVSHASPMPEKIQEKTTLASLSDAVFDLEFDLGSVLDEDSKTMGPTVTKAQSLAEAIQSNIHEGSLNRKDLQSLNQAVEEIQKAHVKKFGKRDADLDTSLKGITQVQ